MAQVTVTLDTIDLRAANEYMVRGRHVDNLQGLLAGTRVPEFSPGPIDGNGGARTLNAVLRFQGTQGLATDPIVGPQTWSALVPFSGGS